MVATGRHTKGTLFHLTRALERIHIAGAGPDTMAIVLFQQRSFFEQSAGLYRAADSATNGGPTVLAAYAGTVGFQPEGNLHVVGFEPEHALVDEWAVIVASRRAAAALVARDLLDTDDAGNRRFDARVTFQPPAVADEIDRVLELLGTRVDRRVAAAFRLQAQHCRVRSYGAGDELVLPLLGAKTDGNALAAAERYAALI